MGSEPVQGAILHVERDDAAAFAVLHEEVEREIFDKELGVVAQRLAVEGV
jgi:hypothetical protein